MSLSKIFSFATSMASVIAWSVGDGSVSLRPRDQAPGFEVNAVINKEFQKISLSDYKGKYVVLLFYPFDFTYVCPTELIAFSEAIGDFRTHQSNRVVCIGSALQQDRLLCRSDTNCLMTHCAFLTIAKRHIVPNEPPKIGFPEIRIF